MRQSLVDKVELVRRTDRCDFDDQDQDDNSNSKGWYENDYDFDDKVELVLRTDDHYDHCDFDDHD